MGWFESSDITDSSGLQAGERSLPLTWYLPGVQPRGVSTPAPHTLWIRGRFDRPACPAPGPPDLDERRSAASHGKARPGTLFRVPGPRLTSGPSEPSAQRGAPLPPAPALLLRRQASRPNSGSPHPCTDPPRPGSGSTPPRPSSLAQAPGASFHTWPFAEHGVARRMQGASPSTGPLQPDREPLRSIAGPRSSSARLRPVNRPLVRSPPERPRARRPEPCRSRPDALWGRCALGPVRSGACAFWGLCDLRPYGLPASSAGEANQWHAAISGASGRDAPPDGG